MFRNNNYQKRARRTLPKPKNPQLTSKTWVYKSPRNGLEVEIVEPQELTTLVIYGSHSFVMQQDHNGEQRKRHVLLYNTFRRKYQYKLIPADYIKPEKIVIGIYSHFATRPNTQIEQLNISYLSPDLEQKNEHEEALEKMGSNFISTQR